MRHNVKPLKKQRVARPRKSTYSRFGLIDGSHPYKKAVPEGYIDYPARRRRGGRVAYFNFALAKEMGLLPADHPHQMKPALSKAILDTFAIQIINEYDQAHKTKIPKADRLPHRYMATRYLQLQHPSRTGRTSGDGRSVWNGSLSHKGVDWDISSCGTGATRLSPATAINKRFYKTGDPSVSYGCGYADLSDGLVAALMSEIFHRNGIPTERVLAVIEFEKGLAINVRAGKNLLRPSHFFAFLKQKNLSALKRSIDFFIARQVNNGTFHARYEGKGKYKYMAEQIARTFARIAARYESDYIFVWLDWDGDNILADGGIIDYGSIRQFGLYHHAYRYDDDDRWSTTIPEQKNKARYLAQTFAQIRHYLKTGKKEPIRKFKKDYVLKIFDAEFERHYQDLLLEKIGFRKEHRSLLIEKHPKYIQEFLGIFSQFEKAKSSHGPGKTPDGITWDPIFCMRDILRELPLLLLSRQRELTPEEFWQIILSSYARRKDRKLTPYRKKQTLRFQEAYFNLVALVSEHFDQSLDKLLLEIGMRASVVNKYDRITGESIMVATDEMLADRDNLSQNELQHVMEDFIHFQRLRPEVTRKKLSRLNRIEKSKSERLMSQLLFLVTEYRENI